MLPPCCRKLSDPGIGSHGNLVDGVCDLAGVVCQLLGMLVLLRAHKECPSLAVAATIVAEWAVCVAASSMGWNAAISRFHDILEPPATPDPVSIMKKKMKKSHRRRRGSNPRPPSLHELARSELGPDHSSHLQTA